MGAGQGRKPLAVYVVILAVLCAVFMVGARTLGLGSHRGVYNSGWTGGAMGVLCQQRFRWLRLVLPASRGG